MESTSGISLNVKCKFPERMTKDMISVSPEVETALMNRTIKTNDM